MCRRPTFTRLGSRNPDPDAFPDWNDYAVVERRRPTGLEMLDNTESDPPVLWDLRFYTDAMVDHDAFAAYVCSRDARATPAPADATRASDCRGIRVFVRASTWAEAKAIATELLEQGRQRCRSEPPSGRWWSSAGVSTYPHARHGPVRFG